MDKKRRGRDKFNKYKNLINITSRFLYIFPLKFRVWLLEQFRMTPGIRGLGIRYILIKSIAKKCGDNVSIYPGVYLFNVQNIVFGNNISIHPTCYIECGPEGTIIIGNDVSVAHGASIMGTSHTYKNIETPIKDQPIETKKVEIRDNVWVGAKATILYGKTIHSGSIVGAHAVVTNDVKENTIVAGVPAIVIRER